MMVPLKGEIMESVYEFFGVEDFSELCLLLVACAAFDAMLLWPFL